MSYNQTPSDFDETIHIEGYKIKYKNLREIGQGAPVIGDLVINGKQMPGYGFGGPLIYQNRHLYIPVYVKEAFYGWGFKLGIINLTDLSIEIVEKITPVIHLDKIENDRIYYFISWDKVKYNHYEDVIK